MYIYQWIREADIWKLMQPLKSYCDKLGGNIRRCNTNYGFERAFPAYQQSRSPPTDATTKTLHKIKTMMMLFAFIISIMDNLTEPLLKLGIDK